MSGPVPAVAVTGLGVDSRLIAAGDVFFACPGHTTDGRRFIADAVERGAAAVVYDPEGFVPDSHAACPLVAMPGLDRQLGVIAERYYDHPSRELFVVGITGTNGKTSCAHLLAQAFEYLGARCGFVGTLGTGFVDELRGSRHTTPDPISLHRELRRLREQDARYVCMEVSSHAMVQGRVVGVSFDAAVFTNLSHDHLDYHRDLDDYADAKAQLFEMPGLRFAVLNNDDPYSTRLKARTRAARTWTYGLHEADVVARRIVADVEGLSLVIATGSGEIDARTNLIGHVNVPNILAVAAVLLAEGRSRSDIGGAMARLRGVPGRMELFRGAPPLAHVVVDYAHTPDALERALRSVREHCRGKLTCVFGCGGNRDRAKRPLMGGIAERLADRVVLTDDNPRFEEPAAIIDEILSGMAQRPAVIQDRVRAIEWAIQQSGERDWIVVAGKGHETTQQVGDRYLPMDDRRLVHELMGKAA